MIFFDKTYLFGSSHHQKLYPKSFIFENGSPSNLGEKGEIFTPGKVPYCLGTLKNNFQNLELQGRLILTRII